LVLSTDAPAEAARAHRPARRQSRSSLSADRAYSLAMMDSAELDKTAAAAAEEVLRVIYGDDLNGCTVRLDDVSRAIRAVLEKEASNRADIADLHAKGLEAVQLLATPPPDGNTLSPEDLRSLLGDRLDKIRDLATKILAATQPAPETTDADTTS
jgi:hypothetical protein